MRVMSKKWRERNKEKTKLYDQKRYERHRDQINSYKHDWYIKNRDRERRKHQKYYLTNKDKYLTRSKRRWNENRDILLALQREYFKRPKIIERLKAEYRNHRDQLSDRYIKGIISVEYKINFAKISNKMIVLKRNQIEILRLKKQIERRIQNGTIRKKHNGTEAIDSTTEKR